MKKAQTPPPERKHVQILRHSCVCKKLRLSNAKLFDMVAKGIFPKPFKLVPGGRAVGWLESDVDNYVLSQRAASTKEAA